MKRTPSGAFARAASNDHTSTHARGIRRRTVASSDIDFAPNVRSFHSLARLNVDRTPVARVAAANFQIKIGPRTTRGRSCGNSHQAGDARSGGTSAGGNAPTYTRRSSIRCMNGEGA